MISALNLDWVSDYIELKYAGFFVSFNNPKVTPVRFTFTKQSEWEAEIPHLTSIFFGFITTQISGNGVATFSDRFKDFKGNDVWKVTYDGLALTTAIPLNLVIRQNLLIEASDYEAIPGVSHSVQTTAIGYRFNLKI